MIKAVTKTLIWQLELTMITQTSIITVARFLYFENICVLNKTFGICLLTKQQQCYNQLGLQQTLFSEIFEQAKNIALHFYQNLFAQIVNLGLVRKALCIGFFKYFA